MFRIFFARSSLMKSSLARQVQLASVRVPGKFMSEDLAKKILSMTKLYGRYCG